MHIKTLVSAAALTAALSFSGFAYAQTMIGNATVSEADMERVKVACEDLQNAANQAAGVEGSSVEGADEPDNMASDSTANVGSIDMDQVTLENCLAGGFITDVGTVAQ